MQKTSMNKQFFAVVLHYLFRFVLFRFVLFRFVSFVFVLSCSGFSCFVQLLSDVEPSLSDTKNKWKKTFAFQAAEAF